MNSLLESAPISNNNHPLVNVASNNSRNPSWHTATTRTILRIKRKRTEDPISCLRLEGLSRSASDVHSRHHDIPRHIGDMNSIIDARGDINNYKNIEPEWKQQTTLEEHHIQNGRQRSSAVLWKRYVPEEFLQSNASGFHIFDDPNTGKSCIRIVNAMFVDDENDNNNNHNSNGDTQHPQLKQSRSEEEEITEPRTKRRKLTVLDTTTADNVSMATSTARLTVHDDNNMRTTTFIKTKKVPLKILDPLTRIVDDSLHDVFLGNKSCEEHYQMLMTDPKFTLQDISLQRKWLSWCQGENGNGGTNTNQSRYSNTIGDDGNIGVVEGNGNILHCCALWNDASTAHQILQYCINGSSTSSSIQAKLLESIDGDGRTPYEVAQLIGHEQVCQVLEAYGGDTTNYVYDIFYLDEQLLSSNGTSNNEKDLLSNNGQKVGHLEGGDNDMPVAEMTAELTSGVGYWTPEGELILEADEKCARSLSHETDGDIDSNCEEYGGNDYPDEEGSDDRHALNYHRQYNDDLYISRDMLYHDDDDKYDEYDWEGDLSQCNYDQQKYDDYDEE